jgi:hypothetical protein
MGRRILLHRFVAVEMVLMLVCLLLVVGGNSPAKVLGFFLAVSALAWGGRERSFLLRFKKDMKGQLARDPAAAFRNETDLACSQSGLMVANSGVTHEHPWAAVEHIGMDRRYIYLLTHGLHHYVIPLSAFGSAEQADRFFVEVERFRVGGGIGG